MTVAYEPPCTTLAYHERPAAMSDQRALRRKNIIAHIAHCGVCDKYHLTVDSPSGEAFVKSDVRILELIAQGFRWKDAQETLGMSDRRFRYRMQLMADRFYAMNQTHLIAIVIALGIIDVRPYVPIVKEHTCKPQERKKPSVTRGSTTSRVAFTSKQ